MDERRLLPLEGLYNFRDLGGYPAAGGKVRWGCLYRGGDLRELRPQAKQCLEARKIRTIVDFRDPAERLDAPDGELATAEKTYSLPIEAGNMLELARLEISAGEALMQRLYLALVDQCRPQYRDFFAILGEPENGPVLFHCSAGKDRTGVAAALVLSALGVDRETVVADYLLSGEYIRGKYRDLLAGAPYLEPFMTVRPGYIAAALDGIDSAFGGMDRYLREELGACPERLRRLYTE
jgi:protein-tyrosine phosphatase